jgi:hypothetical protein
VQDTRIGIGIQLGGIHLLFAMASNGEHQCFLSGGT